MAATHQWVESGSTTYQNYGRASTQVQTHGPTVSEDEEGELVTTEVRAEITATNTKANPEVITTNTKANPEVITTNTRANPEIVTTSADDEGEQVTTEVRAEATSTTTRANPEIATVTTDASLTVTDTQNQHHCIKLTMRIPFYNKQPIVPIP